MATARRKTIESPESKIVKAISFGVFCRFAPSTNAIILSINVFPASEVILIIILSLNTFVPPVTAFRSPPLSLITGADSPVIADSSTVAIPSMTSPSDGIISPVSQITTSSFFKFSAATISSFPSFRRRALVRERLAFRLSA